MSKRINLVILFVGGPRVITRIGEWVSKPGAFDTDLLEYLVVIQMYGCLSGGDSFDASSIVYQLLG